MYNFERFIPGDAPVRTEAELTKSAGILVIHKQTAREHHLDEFGFCTLWWDRNKAVLGIQFEKFPCDHSIPVKRSPTDRRCKLHSVRINCKGFCQQYHIDLVRHTPLTTSWNKSENKLLVSGFRIHSGLNGEWEAA